MYNIGDKVKIGDLSNITSCKTYATVIDDMLKFRGQVAKITDVIELNSETCKALYEIDLDNKEQLWTGDMFTGIVERSTNLAKSTVYLKDNGNLKQVAVNQQLVNDDGSKSYLCKIDGFFKVLNSNDIATNEDILEQKQDIRALKEYKLLKEQMVALEQTLKSKGLL